MRILDFNNFSAIYEAEEFQGQTESTLRRIVNSFFMCYGSMSALTDGYSKMIADLDSIKNAKPAEKLAKMRDVAFSPSEEVTKEFKDANVNTEWKKAADKFVDALSALVKQYEGNEEVITAMDDKVKSMIEEYQDDLKKAKQESDRAQGKATASSGDGDKGLAQAVADKLTGESEISAEDADPIFEGWFQGKKGNIKNLNSQAVALKAQLEGQKDSEGLQTLAGKLIDEVSKIILKLSELSTLKRKDIEETELQEIGNRLNEIPLEITKKEEQLAKSNTANKEASAIYLKGLDIAENAFKMEAAVKDELAKKAEEEAKAKEEEAKAKEEKERAEKKIELSRDLDPEKISGRRRNSEVAKFQEAVIEKFKDYEPFEDFALFQKFVKYGADGMFGNTTKAIVKALKAGFDMDDSSDVITQELMDKIVFEPLDESVSSYKFLRGFSSFDLNEAFDPKKAKSVAPSAPSAPKKEDKKEDEEAAEEKPAIDPEKITEEIQDLLSKANNAIVDLYDDPSYWKEYKGTFNDDEDAAVADVFGKDYLSKGTWWYKKIRVPYVKKAADLLNGEYKDLKTEDSDVWDHLWDEIEEFGETYKQIRQKTVGSSYNDSYRWSLKLYDGSKENFEVDCDF